MYDRCNPIFSMDWDLRSFGVFSSDMSLESPFSCDGSSGYLEDAVADYWSSPNKRLRSASYHSHDQMIHQDLDDHGFANPFMIGTSMARQLVADDFVAKEQSSTPIGAEQGNLYSSSSHSKIGSFGSKNSDYHDNDGSISKSTRPQVVYPFDVVKPGGHEGDLTLQDVNRRLLARPSKPLRHPVGDFVCAASGGLGLSGKTVVALTRIHTRGRGTITVVRTKG